jgi:hypothetical protein
MLKFIQLVREAQRIVELDIAWDMKYNLIFSDEISGRLLTLYHFDWYDPDTSYEEDIRHFVDAAAEIADQFEKVVNY